MADFGIKLSFTGDTKTDSVENQTFHSGYISPKILTDVTPVHFDYFNYTFASNPSVSSTTNLKTVAHGFSYTPMAVVYYRQNDAGFEQGFKLLPWYYSTSNAYVRCIYYTDGTNLKIDFQRDTDGGGGFDALDFTGLNFDFKYYIFVESGA